MSAAAAARCTDVVSRLSEAAPERDRCSRHRDTPSHGLRAWRTSHFLQRIGHWSVPVGVIASAMAQRAGLDLSPLIRAAEDWPRNWAGGREAKQSIGAWAPTRHVATRAGNRCIPTRSPKSP